MRKFNFTSGEKSANFCHVVAKSTTEPENSTNYHKANNTPEACFFVRSFRTPKERLKMACSSMVACNGKGSPFAVRLVKRFLSPLHVTAQTLRSLAVAFDYFHKEIALMIYKFLSFHNGKPLKITVHANSYEEAKNRVQWNNKPLCIVRNMPTPKTQGGVYA